MFDLTNVRLTLESGNLAFTDGTEPMRRGALTPDERDAFLAQLVARWNACADVGEMLGTRLHRHSTDQADSAAAYDAKNELYAAMGVEG